MSEQAPEEAHRQLMLAVLQWTGSVESAGDWDRRDLEVRPDGSGVPFVLQERSARGVGGARGMLPPDVAHAVGGLQQAMFTPGAGTWISAMFSLTADGTGDVRFNHDTQPVDAETGGPGMSAEQVADHLRVFPRDAAHVPDWMTSA